MGRPLEAQIRILQEHYWSDADPDGRGFVSLADAYRRMGKHREALRILRDGLSRHPDYASGHVVRGWVHLEEGDSEDAETAFRAALEVDAENVAALRGLGDLLLERGMLEEALAAFQELIRLDPTDSERQVRVLDLREQVSQRAEARSAAAGVVSEQAFPERPWQDPEGAAEELRWEGAVLQEDAGAAAGESSEEAGWESGGSQEEGPAVGEPAPAAAGDPWPPLAGEAGSGEGAGALWVARDGMGDPVRAEDVLLTRTLGELYLSQGLVGRAQEVFSELLARDPGNQALETRLGEIRALADGMAGRPVGVPGALEDQPAAGVEREVLRVPAADLVREDIEPLAEPAPEAVLPIGDLAPEAISAIGELAPDLIVAIEDLAPDLIVPIEDLAPELIVSIAALAPDPLVALESPPPGSLHGTPGDASERDRGERGSSRDPILEAFEIWLKNLE